MRDQAKYDHVIKIRVSKEMYEKVLNIAKRYDISFSNAVRWCIDMGMDNEEECRPLLVMMGHVSDIVDKMRDMMRQNAGDTKKSRQNGGVW